MMMANFASEYLDPVVEAKQAGEELKRKTDGVFREIFSGYTEITATLDAVNLVATLVELSPPRSKKIEKDDYIKFLIGSHLQEVYMLEQRLTAYATKISRLYGIADLPAKIKTVVYGPLEAIIRTRGSHVHARRYSDEGLDWVAAMALFRRTAHKLGDDLEFEYRRAQLKWSRQIKNNNSEILVIVDRYFELIAAAIGADHKIAFPDRA
ncbi:hypothetical protein M3I54_23735 [Paraburkholderia sp. CNPSo 3274]|uniref:hypothetical protein n=1 Tax=Paraburkholderia sp. CNPSo 3274 TaxID=2940932 RepID=UPI0020B64D9E|nr:hypothetical protein [Paraburkholderia sp. CNPSo 3274]MCP3709955.1 hypothetical protein [Paraburkholderia sp. CNPSo 3274]